MRRSHLARRAIAAELEQLLARRGLCSVIPGFDDTLKVSTIPAAPATLGAGRAKRVDFPSIGKPTSDFQAVRDGRRSTLLAFSIDLSVARSFAAGTALLLPIQGNLFYSDPSYDLSGNSQAGIARVHFQDENFPQGSGAGEPVGTWITVLPNSVYHVPFTQIALENYAQAGKTMRIVYGVDVDLAPGQSAQVQATILNLAQQSVGGVNELVVGDRGYTYGANFASATTLAAATNEQIVAPASNVNGLILWHAEIVTVQATAAANTFIGLLAKTSAPANAIDGDLLLQAVAYCQTSAGGGLSDKAVRERAVLVAAGKGLYFRNSSASAESTAYRSAEYTLL